MMNGRNNGKKIMAVRIVQHAFEIIHLVTEQNPVQVLGESRDDHMEDHADWQSTLSSTLDPVRTLPESVPRELFDDRPSMSPH
jgi:hypothetical protein